MGKQIGKKKKDLKLQLVKKKKKLFKIYNVFAEIYKQNTDKKQEKKKEYLCSTIDNHIFCAHKNTNTKQYRYRILSAF